MKQRMDRGRGKIHVDQGYMLVEEDGTWKI